MTDTSPARTPAVTVVVPTYNERGRIAEFIAALFDVFRHHEVDGEVVVVDDNSPDGTGAVVDELVSRYGERLRIVHRSGKHGLGTAVMAGFAVARADVVGVMDADFSHPPAELPLLYHRLVDLNVDAVVASRYIEGGRVENWPLSRQLLSRVACLLAAPLSPVRDATSGFFLARRTAVEGVAIGAGGFKICLELLMRGRIMAIAEHPYIFTDRAVGESKMSMREAMGYLSQLRDLYRLWLTSSRPRPRYVRLPVVPPAGS